MPEHTEQTNTKGLDSVEIDLEDEDFMTLARMAHEQNITLNQLFCNILMKAIDNEDQS